MSTTPVPLLTERRESSRYDVLFEPVQIGPLTTKNRFLWSCGLRFSLGWPHGEIWREKGLPQSRP